MKLKKGSPKVEANFQAWCIKEGGSPIRTPPPQPQKRCLDPKLGFGKIKLAAAVFIQTWVLDNLFLAYGPPNPWQGSRVQTPETLGRVVRT